MFARSMLQNLGKQCYYDTSYTLDTTSANNPDEREGEGYEMVFCLLENKEQTMVVFK